jgi:DNA-binding CsgD family transcriptional regulator
MSLADELLTMTGRLYAAAAEPTQWEGALEAVVDAFGARHGILDTYRPERISDAVVIGARVDPHDVSRLRTTEAMQVAWPLIGAIPQGVSMRAALISDEDFARTEAYNEVIRPMGGFHGLHLRSNGADEAVLLSLCRPEGAEGFGPEDAAALRMIAPHIQTAVVLQQRLQTLELRHASLARLIDRLEAGVILVDGAGRPVLLNSRAETIVSQADGIVVDTGGLAAATPTATRQLRDAIAAADRLPALPQRLRLERPSRRAPLLLTVLPVWRLDIELPGVTAARVAIMISEADVPPPVNRVAFADTYRLTTRESEVVALIADGHDAQAIASRLGIGTATVRYHVKNLFEKTGVRSQAALLALLRGFTDLTD